MNTKKVTDIPPESRQSGEKDKIQITMNRKQAQLMAEALEFHSRFCAGQLCVNAYK